MLRLICLFSTHCGRSGMTETVYVPYYCFGARQIDAGLLLLQSELLGISC